MPEGHSLHRLARDQQELVGRRVRATSPQGRFAGAAAVDGREIAAVEAIGKHLLHHVDGVGAVHVHLGMRGKFLCFPSPNGEPLKQVRLRLATDDVAWDLIAPIACDLFTVGDVARLRSSLGPDPLCPDADAELALRNLRTSGKAIGAALLDQHLIAGVGNVFRAEALLRSGIHPATPAASLGDERLRDLWDGLQSMMRQAVEDDEIRPKLVYGQESCLRCDTHSPVQQWAMEGRTAYACPTCQPAPAAPAA